MTKRLPSWKVNLIAAIAYVSFAAMIFAAALGKDIINFLFK